MASLKPGTGLPAVWTGPLSRIDTAELIPLGQHRMEGGKIYKYVKFNDGAANEAGVAGEVAYYYLLDGYKNNEVTSDLSDSGGGVGKEVGAGVLVAALLNTNFGWIQIKGPATLTIALTAGADGNPLTPTGATNGTLDVVVTTVALMNPCAYAGDISDKEIMCDFLW